ncbi:PREDICTED: uncharacterized protein LOC108559824 [Nicrophorus vespilloides]|uniref:Uncharacterized protein LOC108559824 n=1 Tax=Nicrophorus vespilloides TaxID=110193 RepID=A0ABM1MDM0_NICVS|nr:PREDICTED: uncharacterized protein LOC108559824 [Nicrophorus vespilloides]
MADMALTNKKMLFLCVCFLLLSRYETKRVDCRKYVFAPICRGAAAKRDIQKFEPLVEPRSLRYKPNGENLFNIKTSKTIDADIFFDRNFLDILLQKISVSDTDLRN